MDKTQVQTSFVKHLDIGNVEHRVFWDGPGHVPRKPTLLWLPGTHFLQPWPCPSSTVAAGARAWPFSRRFLQAASLEAKLARGKHCQALSPSLSLPLPVQV